MSHSCKNQMLTSYSTEHLIQTWMVQDELGETISPKIESSLNHVPQDVEDFGCEVYL